MEGNKIKIEYTTFEGEVFTWEGPWDSDANHIVNAFYSMMIGATFLPETINRAMLNCCDDHPTGELRLTQAQKDAINEFVDEWKDKENMGEY